MHRNGYTIGDAHLLNNQVGKIGEYCHWLIHEIEQGVSWKFCSVLEYTTSPSSGLRKNHIMAECGSRTCLFLIICLNAKRSALWGVLCVVDFTHKDVFHVKSRARFTSKPRFWVV